jgi:glycosyltransferase involved in cell wall biosynthesis
MNSLVSVCIPAYNNGSYISETIKCILEQSYQNLELVIVDDRSTDNTVDVIKSFNDKRIRFYQNETNLGMHGNWNKALSHCKGEFMKLVCGDDLIDRDCIEKQLAVLTSSGNENVVMAVAKRRIIKHNGKEMFGSWYKLPAGRYSGMRAMKLCVTMGTNLIGEPMSVLFRGNVFRNSGIILGSNNYLIDMDMYSKLLQYGDLVMMKEYLAAFRIYSTSMSGSLGMKHSAQFNEFIDQPWLTKKFGINAFHRASGKFLHMNLSIARNLIIRLSGK